MPDVNADVLEDERRKDAVRPDADWENAPFIPVEYQFRFVH